MDLLKKELERKKQAVKAAAKHQQQQRRQHDSGGDGDDGEKRTKYLKASELRRIQEEQEEQMRLELNKRKQQQASVMDDGDGEKSSKKRARTIHNQQESDITEMTTTKRGESTERTSDTTRTTEQQHDESDDNDNGKYGKSATATSDVDVVIQNLSSEQVIQRLREMGLPIQLFGENETHRQERLREAMEQQRHVLAGLNEMDEFRLGSGHGIRNPFLERDVKEDEEAARTQKHTVVVDQSSTARKKAVTGMDDKSTARGTKDDGKDDNNQNDEEETDDPHKRIYRFFKGLLRQWEDDLALRPEAVKRTAAGRNDTKTLKQCKDYIRPLFKLCKTRRLEPSLMFHILKIVDFCEEGEFVKANDAYIDVAIGRAAWPIGVTMVGIHARSGRAKIESANVAHVMNSELQRKYLTSVKRLISYCQKKREDVAPSKKVMN